MRIIGGSARGRKFDAPVGEMTRPTTDRVKESLFGILQFALQDAQVLDLFSGSGNLAFEALSRGAKHAYLNDADRICAKLIKENAKHLKFEERSTIYCQSFEACLQSLAQQKLQFDIVFLDPPYNLGLENKALALLWGLNLLSKDAIIIIEHDKKTQPILPEGLDCKIDQRHYGLITLSILKLGE